MNILKCCCIIICATGLVACAKDVIVPLQNGQYKLVTDGYSKTDALCQARNQAMKHCQSLHKNLEIEHYGYTINNTQAQSKSNDSITQNAISAFDPNNTHIVMEFKCS